MQATRMGLGAREAPQLSLQLQRWFQPLQAMQTQAFIRTVRVPFGEWVLQSQSGSMATGMRGFPAPIRSAPGTIQLIFGSEGCLIADIQADLNKRPERSRRYTRRTAPFIGPSHCLDWASPAFRDLALTNSQIDKRLPQFQFAPGDAA